MRLKKEKCVFLAPEVEYLGYKISKRGIEPTDEKVKAITFAPRPGNVAELRAFLGLINYYSRFLPNLATVLNPLYRLLHKEVDWSWEESHEEAFRAAKELLKSSKVLTHFDSSKDLVLAADAFPYGVGAVLSHCLEDGTEHPIAYTLRTLSSMEKNYSQLDKEALAIIVGVIKFHQYLAGRKFKKQIKSR